MTNTTISIEPMQFMDLEAIEQIDIACFPIPWQLNAFETEMKNRYAAYFVARSGSDVVGYIGGWLVGGEGHITSVAVLPGSQGNGVGGRLMEEIIEELKRRGAKIISLEVRESNGYAQKLYEKFNFVPVASRRGYYNDNGENAVIMWTRQEHPPLLRK